MTRYALALLGLGLWIAGGEAGNRLAFAQTPPSQQNRSNSFNPATTIPFRVSGELFLKGHRPVVSLRIYNVLAQLVAIPILGGTDKPLDSLALSCPTSMGCNYNAYWDRSLVNAGKPATGVYIYQLVIDGKRSLTKKIVVK